MRGIAEHIMDGNGALVMLFDTYREHHQMPLQ